MSKEVVGFNLLSKLPEALTKEETMELMKKYKQTGDKKIREQIFYGNLKQVYYLTTKSFFKPQEWEDVFQDAALKFYDLIDRFDIQKGCSLFTFASVSIQKYLLWLYCKKTLKLRQANHNAVSLEQYLFDPDGKSMNLANALFSKPFDEDAILEKIDLKRWLEKVAVNFDKTDREILRLKFVEDLQYNQIAKRLGLTRATVMARMGKMLELIRMEAEGVEKQGKISIKFKFPDLDKNTKHTFEEVLQKIPEPQRQFFVDYFNTDISLPALSVRYDCGMHTLSMAVSIFQAKCQEYGIETPKTRSEKRKESHTSKRPKTATLPLEKGTPNALENNLNNFELKTEEENKVASAADGLKTCTGAADRADDFGNYMSNVTAGKKDWDADRER